MSCGLAGRNPKLDPKRPHSIYLCLAMHHLIFTIALLRQLPEHFELDASHSSAGNGHLLRSSGLRAPTLSARPVCR
jgi:hypothetical protein